MIDIQAGGESGVLNGTPLDGGKQRVLALLNQTSSQIAGALDEVRAVSEREILACGKVLSNLVEGARQLADDRDQELASALSRSEEVTNRFVRAMREDIHAQELAVQGVLNLASQIEEAITAINDLTTSSRVLAINARIEAARLGADGKGFTVIADSLKDLSGIIRGASDKVTSAIEGVRQGLPSVKASAGAMSERTEVFIQEVASQVKSGALISESGQAGTGVAKLMELSNQALSHLQFQDPMSQKLGTVVSKLRTCGKMIENAFDGVGEANVWSAVELKSDENPSSGDVMLF